MKFLHRPLACLLTALVGVALTGCRTTQKTTHLGSGYEEVSHHIHTAFNTGEEPAPRVSFQYMSPDKTLTRIWPSLYGAPEVIHDGLAIFVGDLSYSDEGNPASRPRLFAVKAPEMPLDITGDVLALWARLTGRNFTSAVQRFNLMTPEADDNGLLLHLEFVNQDYLVVDKNWPDKSDLLVSKIMEKTKKIGIYKEDPLWHTPYLGGKF
jgi:hypothetical protein